MGFSLKDLLQPFLEQKINLELEFVLIIFQSEKKALGMNL